MKFLFVAVVPVPVEQAFAWWSSFSEDDGDPEGPLVRRRVLMAADRDFVLEDTYRYLGREVTLQGAVELDPPSSYRVRYRGDRLRIDLRYMFNEVVEGTQLVVLGTVRASGWLRLLLPLLWPKLRSEIRRGLRGTVQQAEDLLLGEL